MAQIHENSKVTLHFTLRLIDGQVVDGTSEQSPATLTIGDGNLPVGFERHLLGLEAGDCRTVRVSPEDAFGQLNPSNLQTYKKDQFAEAGELSLGTVIAFQDAAGSELPGVIADIQDESIVVDFNHPLAGKDLDFEVEIIAVGVAADGH
ncbi:FKBP-type peptidyl-prolyl cis-trans isomerase [Reinekea sp.]|jgi:FKBP-type peptidyl-prolyl cis-trans isomerase SlpA|uniref:FKBP-type peptidyl-prolyl cis-trans isomerase n=1 Tax=Reinekea sp. TaxID=1970455 RepID=UPI002A805F07|nr:FKBP-type peptidyl-prolyl cis-trans isomerase [Reinekea sp.]